MVSARNEEREFMERAFELAEEALASNEVPVGCVFTYEGREVACGRNEVNRTKDPTTHAEMVALRNLQAENPDIGEVILYNHFFRYHGEHKAVKEILRDLVLYVTLEPCIMCASGLYELANERFGGICSVGNWSKYNKEKAEVEVVVDSTYADRSIALLKSFYDKQNPFAPEEKRKSKKSKQ
ncbi:hypothetical protein Y032_0466g1957 [Ancylostoma ceylanicum]|uniref:CMP/dCMP-type deaminase domain-containing protein n=1 Tax=Ancylostoma ceylanicum TaxID=53326 RepID=A0A016WX59_9BILA|nr:hypothetical protein Y032_0466g1957 [Ancylostoma ceylanicum]